MIVRIKTIYGTSLLVIDVGGRRPQWLKRLVKAYRTKGVARAVEVTYFQPYAGVALAI